MWQRSKTNLQEIYSDLVSICSQLSDVHTKFISLTWKDKYGGGYIGVNEDILPDWALSETNRIHELVYKLSNQLWSLPEVNHHNEHELYIKRIKEKLMLAEGHPTENNLLGG